MKLEIFEIRFDNPWGTYTTGGEVRGNVVLRLRNPMKVRKIILYFEGRSKCHWEERNGRSTTEYRATETYINETFELFDAGQGSGGIDHPAGERFYPFSLVLGASLPSSFEGRRGYVRYFAKASIIRPWKFDEHVKRAFTVIHPVDLNSVPSAGMPVWGEQDESVEGCCCSVGSVNASLMLNKMGFVPGEFISYTIDIINTCDSNIEHVELDLKQTVIYTGYSNSIFSSGHPNRHQKDDIFLLLNHNSRIKPHTEEHIQRAATVPALPPSNLHGCGIIDICYTVALKVNVRWTSITVEREIIIGTIPMHTSRMQREPLTAGPPSSIPSAPPLEPPPYSERGTKSPAPSVKNHALSTHTKLPKMLSQLLSDTAEHSYYQLNPTHMAPPSYEESVFGRVEIRDENDDEHTTGQQWAPSYPVYHYDAATQHFQILPAQPSSAASGVPSTALSVDRPIETAL